MKRGTWYLTPKSQEETQDVPFVIGGLYKNRMGAFFILARVVDDKYFLVRISNGETTSGTPATKNEIQEWLNERYTLVANQIEAKP